MFGRIVEGFLTAVGITIIILSFNAYDALKQGTASPATVDYLGTMITKQTPDKTEEALTIKLSDGVVIPVNKDCVCRIGMIC